MWQEFRHNLACCDVRQEIDLKDSKLRNPQVVRSEKQVWLEVLYK